MFFGGLLYGWGSLVFILIEDGVYSDICTESPESSNLTIGGPSEVVVDSVETTTVSGNVSNYSVIANTIGSDNDANSLTIHNPTCKDRDKRLTLVFTIGSMMFCVGCAIMGQINFKFGSRVTRLCAL